VTEIIIKYIGVLRCYISRMTLNEVLSVSMNCMNVSNDSADEVAPVKRCKSFTRARLQAPSILRC